MCSGAAVAGPASTGGKVAAPACEHLFSRTPAPASLAEERPMCTATGGYNTATPSPGRLRARDRPRGRQDARARARAAGVLEPTRWWGSSPRTRRPPGRRACPTSPRGDHEARAARSLPRDLGLPRADEPGMAGVSDLFPDGTRGVSTRTASPRSGTSSTRTCASSGGPPRARRTPGDGEAHGRLARHGPPLERVERVVDERGPCAPRPRVPGATRTPSSGAHRLHLRQVAALQVLGAR